MKSPMYPRPGKRQYQLLRALSPSYIALDEKGYLYRYRREDERSGIIISRYKSINPFPQYIVKTCDSRGYLAPLPGTTNFFILSTIGRGTLGAMAGELRLQRKINEINETLLDIKQGERERRAS